MIRRLFHILPKMRHIACKKRLQNHDLKEEYLAFSVKRGDTEVENKLDESTLMPYIEKAEIAIQSHFDGKVPTIFVASDDCSIIEEIRQLRPTWKFVGECDTSEENGFILTDTLQWSQEETDRHYEKSLTQMIAMASAKYFIGVSTANVSY